ncbi:MAG: DUF2380 domain-containing protein [Desulfobacterales bacterium]|nr:DUF2380 domain-containing protein [Desulfobacterales bacterium]
MKAARLLPFRPSILLVVVAFCNQSSPLFAQKTTLAVVDFEGFGISQTEAIALTNRLRNDLFRLGNIEVVDRGTMEAILEEQNLQLSGCTSNECLVEVGQLLNVQQIVGGSISKIADIFTVSARVVDVTTGKVIGVADYDLQGSLGDMLTQGMREIASRLVISEPAAVSAGEDDAIEQPTVVPQPPSEQVSVTEKESDQGFTVKERAAPRFLSRGYPLQIAGGGGLLGLNTYFSFH